MSKRLGAIFTLFAVQAVSFAPAWADCPDAGDLVMPQWPDAGQWIPVRKGSNYLVDPNTPGNPPGGEGDDFNSSDHRNLVGDAGYNPTVYLFRDSEFFYFRMRVDEDPVQAPPSDFKSFGWVIEINVDGGVDCNGYLKEFHAYCMLDGTGNGDAVTVRKNNVMGSIGDPSDSADELIYSYPLATYPYARSTAASGHAQAHFNSAINGTTDYLIDIACRIRPLKCATFDDTARMRFIFGTSNSTQGISADLLNPSGVTSCPATSCSGTPSCGRITASASNPYDCPPPTFACVNAGCGHDSDCSGTTPVCDVVQTTCVACNGDYGAVGATRRCSSTSPYCTATGACGTCTSNADCAATNATRSGAFCNIVSGACTSGCSADAECGAGKVCISGGCYVPVGNGVAVVDGGTCNATWSRGCDSGVCDSTDNKCGYANSNGSCDAGVATQVCRSAICDTSDGKCGWKNGSGTCDAGVAAAVCRSAACADGVCCNNACTGQCAACNIAGSVGTCSAVSGQPDGGRAACVGDGTACNGACNGVLTTACTYPGSGTPCRTGSCANGVETVAASCTTDAGYCPTLVTAACNTYACGASACRATCSTDTDCAVGAYCASGSCTAKKNSGASCASGTQCTSGVCIDGVCCDRPCSGQCEACDVSGKVGTCSAVSGVPHGTRSACADGGAGCGGSCNGTVTSACVYPGDWVACRSASCASGTATLAATCNGAGSCGPSQTEACPASKCSGTVCAGDCVVDDDCSSGNYCSAGVCKSKKTNGQTCAGNAQCTSGLCVDGTCCNSACTGQCQACDVGGSLGTCTAVSGAPHGRRPACASDGTSCGGACNGALQTACTYPTSACRSASCANGIATAAASCDGQGNCPPEDRQFCGTYSCGATVCNGDCPGGTDGECPSGKFCSAGICTTKKSNGGTCTRTAQCTSGICVDGVCCSGACAGTCEACNKAGSVGTCAPVSGAPYGTRTPCAGDGTTCAGTCNGDAGASCVYPATSVSCRSASCGEGVATLAAMCDGLGSCGAKQVDSCGSYACDTATCRGTCTLDAHCASGRFCIDVACVTKRATGDSCTSAAQCTSGFCVDGTCCGTACTEQCGACNIAGRLGTCSPTVGAPVGSRTACTTDGTSCGGACDGVTMATCAFPGSSVSCRSGSCADGGAILAAGCSGAGACPAMQTQDCGTYGCGASACAGNCSTDNNCNAGTFCSAGICAAKKAAGVSCGGASQCASGFCVDGVCCNSACTDQCAACDRSGSVGTCGAVTGAPHGARAACSGDGTACQGVCDGTSTSACAFAGSDTVCRSASCASGVATTEAKCEGSGSCPAPTQASCDLYACNGASCGTSCASNSECADSAYCYQGVCRTLNGFSRSNLDVSGYGLRGCALAGGTGLSLALIVPAILLFAHRRRKHR